MRWWGHRNRDNDGEGRGDVQHGRVRGGRQEEVPARCSLGCPSSVPGDRTIVRTRAGVARVRGGVGQRHRQHHPHLPRQQDDVPPAAARHLRLGLRRTAARRGAGEECRKYYREEKIFRHLR